jgi:hypothetical protein
VLGASPAPVSPTPVKKRLVFLPVKFPGKARGIGESEPKFLGVLWWGAYPVTRALSRRGLYYSYMHSIEPNRGTKYQVR